MSPRLPTSDKWREGSLGRTTADWPFDWVAEITAIDPLTHSYTCIGTVRQAGTRRYDEALANLRVMTRAPAMLRILKAISQVLDMSDPDHDAFVDSAADCLDALLRQQEPLRALLSEFARSKPAGALLPLE
ncbi:MAG: hypothetical protein KGJ57_21270 [Sphingomonadales bacterium]|nr:hypothetical protein [Sphingomonadales bacterium]MDE2171925.1 hypothetical protein [Sphingomonadales bacterium]